MLQIMWAVYNSEASKIPRAIFSRKDDADNYHRGMHWGMTVRVEIEAKFNEKTITLRGHEFRYVQIVKEPEIEK